MKFTYYTKEGKSTSVFYNDMPFNKLHRLNGPAIICNNGHKEWYVNGKRHRLDCPAIIWHNGDKEWWINGKKHRSDGPAVIWVDGDRVWYQNGKLHRLDGPAYIMNNGYNIWYINDKKLNTKKVETWIKNNNINLKTKQHQVLFMVLFG